MGTNDASAVGSHAIVIGGSMAGLLAARVLTEHFDRVTVIERDHALDGPDIRKGVPQARHVHALLMQGQMIMEHLFPGLAAELVEHGALEIDWLSELPLLVRTGWSPRVKAGLTGHTCSRALLEWCIRRRLNANQKVCFVNECEVTELIATEDKARIMGVRYAMRSAGHPAKYGGTGRDETLSGDLIVDASGRDAKTPQWLQALGYPTPEETTVNSFVGYASRRYQRPTLPQASWKGIMIFPRPPHLLRGGLLYPEEDGRWVLSLGGANRDYPSTDEEGFMEFARSLASTAIYEQVKNAEPITPIMSYQRTENRIRHYERYSRWPEQFVVTGDSACAFNPIYGQGMSISAMAAQLLDGCLREQRQRSGNDLTGLGLNFQKRLAKMNHTPWVLATGEDLRYPATEGTPPTRVERVMQRYVDQIMLAMPHSPAIGITFLQVLHLRKPPTALMAPSIAGRVLWDMLARMGANGEKRKAANWPEFDGG